ncbi:MAG: hypothetical protein ACRCYU_10780 [Nocardioides sp.]
MRQHGPRGPRGDRGGSRSISRRWLLGGALGAAGGAVLVNKYRHDWAVVDRLSPSSSPGPTGLDSATPSPKRRFPGDPGPSRLLLGVSLAINQPAAARSDIGGSNITVARRFYRSHQLDLMRQMVRGDAAADIVPFVSLKTPESWQDVADGRADGWLAEATEILGSLDVPAYLSLHHEPENDHSGGGNTPAAWQQMHRRAGKAAQPYPRLGVVPVLMQWTFDPASGRNPRQWLMPDLPVLGVDVYNPWRDDRPSNWVEFGDLMTQIRRVVPDTPIIVPEFGSAADKLDPERASLWLRAAYDSALTHNVAGLVWFDSEYNNDRGDIRLDTNGIAVMRELLSRPETVRWNSQSA